MSSHGESEPWRGRGGHRAHRGHYRGGAHPHHPHDRYEHGDFKHGEFKPPAQKTHLKLLMPMGPLRDPSWEDDREGDSLEILVLLSGAGIEAERIMVIKEDVALVSLKAPHDINEAVNTLRLMQLPDGSFLDARATSDKIMARHAHWEAQVAAQIRKTLAPETAPLAPMLSASRPPSGLGPDAPADNGKRSDSGSVAGSFDESMVDFSTCWICGKLAADCKAIPCLHVISCGGCAKEIVKQHCPYCASYVAKVVRHRG